MTRKGVWDIQDVRDKLLAGDPWEFKYQMWNWGPSGNGNLGHNKNPGGSIVPPAQQLGEYNQAISGPNQALLTRDDGTLWSCGYGGGGQLGINQGKTGSGWSTNYHDRSSPVQVPGTIWSSIACGNSVSLATRTDGTLWSWGKNSSGELGISQPTNSWRSSPTQVGSDTTWMTGINYGDQQKLSASSQPGSSHCLAIKTDGTLWAWGENYEGHLGHNDVTPRNSPVQVGSSTDWAYCSAGEIYSGALKTDGTAWAWGRNSVGQLGQNNRTNYSSPVQVPGTDWTKISATQSSSVIGLLKSNGTAYVMGSNATGEIGNGYSPSTGSNGAQGVSRPTQIPGSYYTVACCGETTVLHKTDGSLWGTGGNWGTGNPVPTSSPVRIGSKTWYLYNDKSTIFGNDRNVWLVRPNMTPSEL